MLCGEIKARIWYSERVKFNLKQQENEQTGLKETKYSISLNNFKINFYKKLSKFKNYDTINETRKIKIFSNFYLPITITKMTNYETILTEVTYDQIQARELATDLARKKLEERMPIEQNIVNETINIYETGESVEVEVIYEVIELIGTKEKIVF